MTSFDGQEREALIEKAYDDEIRRSAGEYPRLRKEGLRLVKVGYRAALAAREEPQGEIDDREWTAYGEHEGAARAGETMWTGPHLKPGERVTVVPKSRLAAREAKEPSVDTGRHEHIPEHKGGFTACMRCGEMPDRPIHKVEPLGHVYDHDLTTGLWTCECGYATNDPDAIEAHRRHTEQEHERSGDEPSEPFREPDEDLYREAPVESQEDKRRWHAYGEQNMPLAGRTTLTGPDLKMGERLVMVPEAELQRAEERIAELEKSLGKIQLAANEMVDKWPGPEGQIFELIARETRAVLNTTKGDSQ